MIDTTRRAMAAMGLLPVLNPIGRRDYEKLLDEAVSTEIQKRFGVLCTRLGKPDNPQAVMDFQNGVQTIFEARKIAEELLREELNK